MVPVAPIWCLSWLDEPVYEVGPRPRRRVPRARGRPGEAYHGGRTPRDVKVFFDVVNKDPADDVPTEVLACVSAQRRPAQRTERRANLRPIRRSVGGDHQASAGWQVTGHPRCGEQVRGPGPCPLRLGYLDALPAEQGGVPGVDGETEVLEWQRLPVHDDAGEVG